MWQAMQDLVLQCLSSCWRMVTAIPARHDSKTLGCLLYFTMIIHQFEP
jgi:hypothetical protein